MYISIFDQDEKDYVRYPSLMAGRRGVHWSAILYSVTTCGRRTVPCPHRHPWLKGLPTNVSCLRCGLFLLDSWLYVNGNRSSLSEDSLDPELSSNTLLISSRGPPQILYSLNGHVVPSILTGWSSNCSTLSCTLITSFVKSFLDKTTSWWVVFLHSYLVRCWSSYGS